MRNFEVGDLIELRTDCARNMDYVGRQLPSFGEVVECVDIYIDCGIEFIKFRYLGSGNLSTDWYSERFTLAETPMDIDKLLDLI